MTHKARYTAAVPLWIVATAMLALAGSARAQAPLLEVEKSDATKLLQVNDDAGFLVRGASGTGTIPAAGPGVRLMWYPGKAAFRAGEVSGTQWNEGDIGPGSSALGRNTRATGRNSLALNEATEATGDNAIAGGYESIASGAASLAVGDGVTAGGFYAVALGAKTLAGGNYSFAAGFQAKATGSGSAAFGGETQASGTAALAAGSRTQAKGIASLAAGDGSVAAGQASVALGSGVTAQGNGSFVFGDRNIQHTREVGPNAFWVRAFGGIRLNTGPFIGCELAPNSGAWSCSSSKLVKEDFETVDGEEVLARLKEVPIQSWRYIGTEARHLGPFAEDFHAAFGLGADADKIAQIDADGVALSAVQALERRTTELQAENAELRAEAGDLRRRVEALESAGRWLRSHRQELPAR